MSLTPRQKAAIQDYTDKGYERINQQLRDHRLTPATATKIAILTAALDQLPAFRGDVYRGTTLSDRDLLERYRAVGSEVIEPAFTSASRSPLKMYGGNVLFYVVSKRGRDVSHWSAQPEEEEVLFRPGTRFKVLAFEQSGGDFEIFLEES